MKSMNSAIEPRAATRPLGAHPGLALVRGRVLLPGRTAAPSAAQSDCLLIVYRCTHTHPHIHLARVRGHWRTYAWRLKPAPPPGGWPAGFRFAPRAAAG